MRAGDTSMKVPQTGSEQQKQLPIQPLHHVHHHRAAFVVHPCSGHAVAEPFIKMDVAGQHQSRAKLNGVIAFRSGDWLDLAHHRRGDAVTAKGGQHRHSANIQMIGFVLR